VPAQKRAIDAQFGPKSFVFIQKADGFCQIDDEIWQDR
jgi:hypothetical protein